MKLISSLKGLVLAVTLVCVARAEQRVIVVNVSPDTSFSGPLPYPNLTRIQVLLSAGWKVVHMAVAGTGAQFGSDRQFTYVFILESPTKEATK